MKAVGIDLGTTNSVIAVMEGDEVTVIVNQEGKRTTPSVVAYRKDGEILIGEIAKRQAVLSPERTFYSVKRIIGKTYDEAKDVIKDLPYGKLIKEKNNQCVVELDGKTLYIQEISAHVLRKLKKAAEDYLGVPVTDAVITVPAYFNDAQRKATKEAGEMAGLNVIRIINEPTAASLAYGVDKDVKQGKIAVFDLGGGTFDISILEVSDGVFEVLATAGDTNLGGDNFDEKIINRIVETIQNEHAYDVRNDARAMQRIKEAAEVAKIELSSQSQTEISLPYLFIKPDGNVVDVTITITRTEFEAMCEDLYERIRIACRKAIEAANISGVDAVVLVGGSTRMPKIRELAREIFGKEPLSNINPDEAVAIGAAIQAAVLKGEVKDILLLDVIPISLGIEANNGIFVKMIEANTTIPTKRTQTFTTVVDNQKAVEIHVLQGERPMAADNKSLGRFILDGIPPAPAGIPRIDVTFDIDSNGILTVTAVDAATQKAQSIRIQGTTSLPKDEIERIKREAEENAEKDKIRKRKAELVSQINILDSQFAKIHDTIQDDNTKARIKEIQKDLLELKEKEDLDYIENKIKNYQAELYNMMAANQQNQNPTNEQEGVVENVN